MQGQFFPREIRATRAPGSRHVRRTLLMLLALPAVLALAAWTDISAPLAAAIMDLDRAVEARLHSTSPRSAPVLGARDELERRISAFIAAVAPTVSAQPLDELARDSRAYLQKATALLRDIDRRSALEREYRALLGSIDTQIGSSASQGWKFMGRLVARQYVVELQNATEDLRLRSERVLTARSHDAAALESLNASIAAFSALLATHARRLARGEGSQRLEALQASSGRIRALGQQLAALDRRRGAALTAFQSAGTALAADAQALYVQSITAQRAAPADTVVAHAEPPRESWPPTAAAIALSSLLLFVLALRVPAPVRRFMVAMRRVALRNDAARHSDEIRYMEAHDLLTKLPNRGRLVDHLHAALEQADRTQQRIAVLFIDLDNFKTLNDSVSHGFGDRVLIRIAEQVSRLAGPTAFVARPGGDEFAVVLPVARDEDDPAWLGHQLVHALARSIRIDDRELTLGISVGAAVYPDHAACADTLLSAADAAMFHAKASGRGRLSMFNPLLLEAASQRFRIEQGLRRAIERDELELVYQPEVCARTLRVSVLEALVRWRMPDGTLALPGQFLAVAEESGLICDIGHWVLKRAIDTAAQWRRAGGDEVRVAINVSARQLLERGFVERVTRLLAEADLPARCIELELTEDALQTGPETIDVLRALRAAGIAVALDDFGAGYSSLASLEQLPLSRVKLDRCLIAGIHTSARARAIAKSVANLCRKLRVEITAEGIEHREQLSRLLPERAMHLQGFLIGRPVGAEQVPALVAGMALHMHSLLRRYEAPAALAASA